MYGILRDTEVNNNPEERRKALEKILGFINTKDVFPIQEDYDKVFTEDEQKQLIQDLGEKDAMKQLGIVHPSAIFSILALREMRKRKGEEVYIAQPELFQWNNSTLFENPY